MPQSDAKFTDSLTQLTVCGFSTPEAERLACEMLTALLGRRGVRMNVVDYVPREVGSLFRTRKDEMDRQERRRIARLNIRHVSRWREAVEASAGLVHVHHWNGCASSQLQRGLDSLTSAGKRFLVSLHHPAGLDGGSLFSRPGKLLAAAEAVVVANDDDKRLVIEKQHVAADKIVVLPYGVPDYKFGLATIADYSHTGLNPERRYVLAIQAGWNAATLHLLHTWRMVMGRCPDVDLVIMFGARPMPDDEDPDFFERRRLKRECQTLLADETLQSRVVVYEGQPTDSLIDMYCRIASLGIFLKASGSGYCDEAARAAALGLPVVVAEGSANIRLALAQQMRVPPTDASALAASLSDLLTDPVGINNLRALQYEHVQPLTWPCIAEQYLALYRHLFGSAEAPIARSA